MLLKFRIEPSLKSHNASNIPQYTILQHNSAHVYFCYKMVHCGIWKLHFCDLGDGSIETGRFAWWWNLVAIWEVKIFSKSIRELTTGLHCTKVAVCRLNRSCGIVLLCLSCFRLQFELLCREESTGNTAQWNITICKSCKYFVRYSVSMAHLIITNDATVDILGC